MTMNARFADRTLSRSRRRFMIFLIAAATALVGSAFVQQQPAHAATWNLVWADEFNGSGAPSSANWNYGVGNASTPASMLSTAGATANGSGTAPRTARSPAATS